MGKWGNRFTISMDDADLPGILHCMEANARECGCNDFVVYHDGDAVGWCSPPDVLVELPNAEVLSRG